MFNLNYYLFIFCSLVPNVNEAYLHESCERICCIFVVANIKIKYLQKCNKSEKKLFGMPLSDVDIGT